MEHDLLQVKSKYIGKKGYLTDLFSSLKEIAPENRKSYGIELNQVKMTLTNLINQKNIRNKIKYQRHKSRSRYSCKTPSVRISSSCITLL